MLAGLDAADRAGLKVKINAVALRESTKPRLQLVAWAHGRGYDLTFIEVMPLGGLDRERLVSAFRWRIARRSRSAGP